ncbi:MAG: IS481 family transposase [Chloroflexi bacterium]|nr:IS481 family transposase [Chloroflexota bacterium]
MPHPNARLTPHGRALLVTRISTGWTITAAARAAGISRQTGSKWWHRANAGQFVDRSSAVHHQARRHPDELVAALCARRRELRVGPHVLGWQTGLARSSVYAILRREGLGRLDRLDPKPAVVRYERERPGELVHLDTKMLGRIGPGGGHRVHGVGVKDKFRGIGWDRVHIAIDDHSRLAYAEELPDESPKTTAAFLRRAWRFYAGHGITIERILTDNGGCYRSRELAAACDELGIGHRRTRPYRPQTNGKAERMVRTLMAEWAYARPFTDTADRVASLPAFIDFYNQARPHWSLAGQPPISRTPVNNPSGKNG